MKKILISFMLILTLLVCFASCGPDDETKYDSESSETKQSLQTSETSQTTCEILNELVREDYSRVELDITTVTGTMELKSNYVLTDSVVTYSVERLNLLPVGGNVQNASPDYKSVSTGTARIENGKVVKIDDETVILPSYDELKGCFDFKESNFKNIQTGSSKFMAEVTSPSDFLGTDKSISNMKIVVEYTSSVLQKITMIYELSDSTVNTVYWFEK